MYSTGDYSYQKGVNVLQFYDMAQEQQYQLDVQAQGRVSSVTPVRQDAVVVTTDDGYIQSSLLVKSKQQKRDNRFKMEEEEMFQEVPQTPGKKYQSKRTV